jgi:hypothetical protein
MEISAYDKFVAELCATCASLAVPGRGSGLVLLSCSSRAPLKNHAITENLMGAAFLLASRSGFDR